MKYCYKFKTRNKTYFADTFADNEVEATQAIKHAMPNAQDILIKDKKGHWRKPKDSFFNVRWFYAVYALLFVAGCVLIN